MVSSNLSTATRIIVVFGEPIQDLGIWAYRSVGKDGVNAGSAVSFAKAVLHPKTKQEGTNLNSDKKEGNTAPRPSAVDPQLMMTRRNIIPNNGNWFEHIASVFQEILADRGRLVREDATIDIVGVADGGQGVIRYLADHCKCPCTLNLMPPFEVWPNVRSNSPQGRPGAHTSRLLR